MDLTFSTSIPLYIDTKLLPSNQSKNFLQENNIDTIHNIKRQNDTVGVDSSSISSLLTSVSTEEVDSIMDCMDIDYNNINFYHKNIQNSLTLTMMANQKGSDDAIDKIDKNGINNDSVDSISIGKHHIIDLIPNGRDVLVTNNNKMEYVSKMQQWLIRDR